jgi:hypothetical protein
MVASTPTFFDKAVDLGRRLGYQSGKDALLANKAEFMARADMIWLVAQI